MDTIIPTTPNQPAASAPIQANAPAASAVAELPVPGTGLYTPVGAGVEQLIAITPKFRTNAPPWYANGVWGQLGCAVPQPGRYLQSLSGPILTMVHTVAPEIFDLAWKFPDRKFTRFPSKLCLWQIHQLLVVGRSRLFANAIPTNDATAAVPTHATPAPQMFSVWPIPIYGPLGCANAWLRDTFQMMLLMLSEMMQHSDNGLSYYYTPDFVAAINPYITYTMVSLANKFFGVDRKTAMDPNYVVPDAAWQSYDPSKFSVSSEGTSTRPVMGWDPTDLDLEPIRGLQIEKVLPFLQPWPDSQLKYSLGGIWQGQPQQGQPAGSSSAQPASQTGGPGQVDASILPKSGPP